MNKYEKTRSVHDEHRAYCSQWKIDNGNDFVDEAMSLAEEQAIADHRFGKNKGRMPNHVELDKMTSDFLKAGGKISVVTKVNYNIDLNKMEYELVKKLS